MEHFLSEMKKTMEKGCEECGCGEGDEVYVGK